jgi:hypothetical protein
LNSGDDDTDDWFGAAVKKKEEDEKRLNIESMFSVYKSQSKSLSNIRKLIENSSRSDYIKTI